MLTSKQGSIGKNYTYKYEKVDVLKTSSIVHICCCYLRERVVLWQALESLVLLPAHARVLCVRSPLFLELFL